MSLTLLTFILFADKYIEQVPIAALVGVMFMMVIETFAWSSFRIINKIPRTDLFVLILVSGLTVLFDLAIAVIAGVIGPEAGRSAYPVNAPAKINAMAVIYRAHSGS